MFEVIVTNEILGNSRQIMSMAQLENYNKCALLCAKKAELDGGSHTMGMWTVRPAEGTEQLLQPGIAEAQDHVPDAGKKEE